MDQNKKFPAGGESFRQHPILLVILKSSLTAADKACIMFSINSMSLATLLKISFTCVILATLSGLVLSGHLIIFPEDSGEVTEIEAKTVKASRLKQTAQAKAESQESQESFAAPVGIMDSATKFAALNHFDDAEDQTQQSDANLPAAVAPMQILDPAWKGVSL